LYVYVIKACLCPIKSGLIVRKIKIITLTMVAAFTFGLMGCAGPMNNTERGATQGAVLGGILGAVIGHNKGRKTAEGAAIGALGGAVLGGAVGNRQDKQSGNK
jgi:hypothetical protein